MEQVKGILQSRTVWSLIVAGGAAVAAHAGFTVSDADKAELINDALQVAEYGGMIAAAIFRITATKVVKPFAKG